MTIATKNGSIIVKDGKLAEDCGCCGGWWCYADYGSCCGVSGSSVSVVFSLSGYLECSLSGSRLTFAAESQTAIPDYSSPAWSHQRIKPATSSTDGRIARLNLSQSSSVMQFTMIDAGILPVTLLRCGGVLDNGFFVPVTTQPTESHLCADVVNALRSWDWIVGKTYSTYTPAGGDLYARFCKIDITGVVY
jgi:hypothetical protein